LRSVLREIKAGDKICLIDNGSTNGSLEYVRRHYPSIKLIRFSRNFGFAEAYNRAVKMVEEEFVVFLNNDVEVGRGWLRELRRLTQRSPKLAAGGSKILFFKRRDLVNHAGGKLVPIGGGLDIGLLTYEKKHDSRPRPVGCVSGASMIVRREVFLRLGGFDSDFFAYFEDVDFCWRAWLNGYEVLLIPSSRVYHKLSATMGPLLTPQRLSLGERNRLQTMLKNLEWINVVNGLFVTVLYNFVRIVGFLRSHRPRAVLAILRGDLWVLHHLSKIIIKRSRVQAGRRISDVLLMRRGLMISLSEGFREFTRLAMIRTSDVSTLQLAPVDHVSVRQRNL
jgi:GT2 family glycosyltransferase